MEGWVGLGTTAVSKQFAQDYHATIIAVVGGSNLHASLGKSAYAASSKLLPGAGAPSIKLIGAS